MYLKSLSVSFEYFIKPLESLKCFESLLSVLLIKNFALYQYLAYKEILSVPRC